MHRLGPARAHKHNMNFRERPQVSWEKFGTVYEAFQASAQAAPEAPLLRIVADAAQRYGIASGSLSYGAALREVERLASVYRTANLGPGRRVALLLGNRPEFFLHWLALNSVGVSAVPLNPDWGAAEVQYVLGHSGAALAVTEAKRRKALEGAAKHLPQPLAVVDLTMARSGNFANRPDGKPFHRTDKQAGEPLPPASAQTECALLYTSGTTGKPKGCVLLNEYFLWSGEWYRRLGGLCELQPGRDCLMTPLPMHHMNAMACSSMAMLMTGGCIAPLDRFHPSTWWASVREAEATIIHYLGVMPAMLLERDPDPLDARHRVRFGFGAGVSAAHHAAFERRFGFPLVEAWAMTETGCAAAVIANIEPRKVGTACFGRPPPEVDWRIVNDAGEDCAPNETGELLVRRAGRQPRFGFFREYLHDPQATETAWEGGHFHTGDLVCKDDDGLLHFVDRKKNLIRRSGENIAAVEVEAVIAEHPQVAAVGVAAVPDRIRGDEVMALVVVKAAPKALKPKEEETQGSKSGPAPLKPETGKSLAQGSAASARMARHTGLKPEREKSLAQAIVAHCRQRLAYYKAPGYVAFCERLPLTATEKVQRADLKALAEAKLAAGTCVDTRDLKRR